MSSSSPSKSEPIVVKLLKEKISDKDAQDIIPTWYAKKPTRLKINSDLKFHFMVFKALAELVSHPETDNILEEVKQLCTRCHDQIVAICSKVDSDSRVKEAYHRLYSIEGQLGYFFQKRNLYNEGMKWCSSALECYSIYQKKEKSNAVGANINVVLILAECYHKSDNVEAACKALVRWFKIDPTFCDVLDPGYDVYESLPWNWITHWLNFKLESKSTKTILDYLNELESVDKVADQIRELNFNGSGDINTDSVLQESSLSFSNLSYCRFEINLYFTGRQFFPDCVKKVGEILVSESIDLWDTVLGMLAQAVAYWWGEDDSVENGIDIIHSALKLINDDKHANLAKDPTMVLLSSMVIFWRGLLKLKKCQLDALAQVEELQELKTRNENIEEIKKDPDNILYEKTIPGLSNLTYREEAEWATNLIDSIDAMSCLTENERNFKDLLDKNCPAFVLKTCRLVAHIISCLGETVYSLKAWHVVYLIAKIYDRKGLIVLSASEIMKYTPITQEYEMFSYAKNVNDEAFAKNEIKHNKAIYYRLNLSEAISSFHTKSFKEGLLCIEQVMKHLESKDRVDSALHLGAELDIVLAMYQNAKANLDLDFSSLPEEYREMSALGFATKSLKVLCAITRNVRVEESGWTDMLHNYFVLSSLLTLGPIALQIMKDGGRVREFSGFSADLINACTTLGFVSRTFQLVMPFVEHDVDSNNFDAAQLKIDTFNKLLVRCEQPRISICPEITDEKLKMFVKGLNIPGMNLQRLADVSDLEWFLKPVDKRNFYYKYRSEKATVMAKINLNPLFGSTKIKTPPFMRHPLNCLCYICCHPSIICHSCKFLIIQAKYAVAMEKWKTVFAILEMTKLLHQRALFRILFLKKSLASKLSFLPKQMSSDAIELAYSIPYVNSAIEILESQMEMTPSEDLSHILETMLSVVDGIDVLDRENWLRKSFPLTIGCSAAFKHLVIPGIVDLEDGVDRLWSDDDEDEEMPDSEMAETCLYDSFSPERLKNEPPVLSPVRKKNLENLPPPES